MPLARRKHALAAGGEKVDGGSLGPVLLGLA